MQLPGYAPQGSNRRAGTSPAGLIDAALSGGPPEPATHRVRNRPCGSMDCGHPVAAEA